MNRELVVRFEKKLHNTIVACVLGVLYTCHNTIAFWSSLSRFPINLPAFHYSLTVSLSSVWSCLLPCSSCRILLHQSRPTWNETLLMKTFLISPVVPNIPCDLLLAISFLRSRLRWEESPRMDIMGRSTPGLPSAKLYLDILKPPTFKNKESADTACKGTR